MRDPKFLFEQGEQVQPMLRDRGTSVDASLENDQQEAGTVRVPEARRPHLGGLERIERR